MSARHMRYLEWQLLRHMVKNCREKDGRVLRVSESGVVRIFSCSSSFTKFAVVAAISCIESGLLVVAEKNQWGTDYKASAGGMMIAKSEICIVPASNPRPLRDEHFAILRSMDSERWYAPIDLGGSCRSNHSRLLQQLNAHGLVETRSGVVYPRQPSIFRRGRGSQAFRLTKRGESHECRRGKKKPKGAVLSTAAERRIK